jgi:succinoglycan biosynthesis protein ExoL
MNELSRRPGDQPNAPFHGSSMDQVNIVYFVHDISHPDTERRTAMLRQGGGRIAIFGFRRGNSVETGSADTVVDLGRTKDGDFLQRIWSMIKVVPRLGTHAAEIAKADVIVARNLEMLVLGAVARRRFAPGKPLIYECLDIHRFMTRPGVVGTMLRRIEGALLKRSQGIMTSSPGFVREYFAKMYKNLPRTFIVENKVVPEGAESRQSSTALPPGPPWRIGWYGLQRCRRSLEILTEVLRREPGLATVIVAGRPSKAIFGDPETAFGGIPGLTYLGAFADEAALAKLFASSHFAWSMDFHDAGANSDWLLPNRLYRAAYYGSVPIALEATETGKWLHDHDSGIRMRSATPDALIETLRAMTPESFAAARGALDRIPTTDLVTEQEECTLLVQGLKSPAGSSG